MEFFHYRLQWCRWKVVRIWESGMDDIADLELKCPSCHAVCICIPRPTSWALLASARSTTVKPCMDSAPRLTLILLTSVRCAKESQFAQEYCSSATRFKLFVVIARQGIPPKETPAMPLSQTFMEYDTPFAQDTKIRKKFAGPTGVSDHPLFE